MASGMRIEFQNLREVAHGLDVFGDKIWDAVQDAAKGEGGQAVVGELRAGMGGHNRTGTTLRGIGIHPGKYGGVEIGYRGALSFGNRGGGRDQRGVWLESGTNPHRITARNGKSLLIAGGTHVENVDHPGTKAYGIARKALRRSKWEMESAIIDQLHHIRDGASTP